MMNIKSLVYSRSSPLKLFPHTQQQTLSKNCIKSQVYSRMPTESSLLEGTSFEAQFRSVSSKLQTVLSGCHLAVVL